MADSSGQQDIRGIDIDKLAKGFADEANIFKKFLTISKTKAREIRWYSKTSGFLAGVTTTGVTGDTTENTSFRSLPSVVEQSWTRNTSYIKKYFVESPLISMEDIKDTDIDILATNVRDLVRAVARRVDLRIYRVLSDYSTEPGDGGNVNTSVAVADGWNDVATGNPITDILEGKRKIRVAGYDPEGCVMIMNPIEHEYLLEFLISVKGSSIPQFSSEKVRSGVVMGVLGCNVVVSENAQTDFVVMAVPNRACTWKSFSPITSVVIDDPGIGKKIRVWEEGEAILTDPLAVHVITDTTV
jgi:hypothetical protein